MDHVVRDLGDLNVTTPRGNNFILVMVDLFSRFEILSALPDKRAATAAKQLVQKIFLVGCSKIISHDHGLEVDNQLINSKNKQCGIDHRLSSPYNPLGNAANESFVGIAKRTIVKLPEEKEEDWDLFLLSVQYVMNNKYSRQHKARPFEYAS